MAFGVMFRFPAPTPLFFEHAGRVGLRRQDGGSLCGRAAFIAADGERGGRWGMAVAQERDPPGRGGGGCGRNKLRPSRREGGCKKIWGRAFFSV